MRAVGIVSWVALASASFVAGCELIASVDHDKIRLVDDPDELVAKVVPQRAEEVAPAPAAAEVVAVEGEAAEGATPAAPAAGTAPAGAAPAAAKGAAPAAGGKTPAPQAQQQPPKK